MTLKALRLALCLAVAGASAPALALTVPGFDHAQTLSPQDAEVGGGLAFGDDIATLFATARLGLLDDLEVGWRAALVDVNGDGGLELGVGPRFSFLRAKDTGFVDVAATAMGGLLKTGDVVVLGADPALVASRHLKIGDRTLVLGLTLGMALTHYDLDGGHSDYELGLLGAFAVSYELRRDLGVALELRRRDDTDRLGVAVTYVF